MTATSHTGDDRLPAKWGAPLALFVAAAAYFSASYTLSIEWSDEGQFMYFSWLVSRGSLPYRDFQALHGPSYFFVNAALFRLFGDDMYVVRLSMLIVKAALSVCVYAAARSIASRASALVAYALFLVTWGSGLSVLNVSYPNYYAMLLNLLALIFFLRLRDRTGTGAFVAGLCFGAASTFKMTSGIFALIGFVLYATWTRTASTGVPSRPNDSPPLGWRNRALSAGALFGSFAVLATYHLRAQNSAWNMLVLFAPAATGIAILASRELTRRVDAPAHRAAIRNVILCLLGFAVPLAGYAFYYGLQGAPALPILYLTDLGRLLEIFAGTPPIDARTALFGAALMSFLIAARLLAGGASRRGVVVGWIAAACIAAALVSTLPLSDAWLPKVAHRFWYDDVYRLLFFLPPLVVWASLPAVFGEEREQKKRQALAAYFFYAAAALSYLYPVSDFWHVLMCLPAFLPLLAHTIDRVCALEAAPSVSPRNRIAAAAIALVVALPFVHTLVSRRAAEPPPVRWLDRATRLTSPGLDVFQDLVSYLEHEVPASRDIWAVGNLQAFYFLAGRRSPFDREEFAMNMLSCGYLPAEAARAVLNQRAMSARLDERRPLLVVFSPGIEAFHRLLPDLASFVDANYAPLRSFDRFTVLGWRGEPARR